MVDRLRLVTKGALVVLISIISSMLTFVLHDLTTPVDFEKTGELSLLAQSIGAKATTILWGFTAFLLISVIFIVYEKNLSGSRARRAILFGGLTGATWVIEMMELDQSVATLLMGLVDGGMVVVVCLLVALLITPNRESDVKPLKVGSRDIFEICFIALTFGLYRLLFGLFLGNYFDGIGDYIVIPIYSVLMGVLWVFLKNMAGEGTYLSRAAKYSVFIWGVPSSIFMYFIAFCFANMFIGMTVRNSMDILVMLLVTGFCLKKNKALV